MLVYWPTSTCNKISDVPILNPKPEGTAANGNFQIRIIVHTARNTLNVLNFCTPKQAKASCDQIYGSEYVFTERGSPWLPYEVGW